MKGAAAQATVFVPATVGNVGPGFDVLGLAFAGLGDKITVRLTDGESKIESVSGRDAKDIPRDPKANCAVVAALDMLRRIGSKHGVAVSIDRQLPLSGGLGGSAAASVGGAYAALLAAGKNAAHQMVMAAALAGEAMVAGRHLDNIAPCLLGGLTLVLDTDKFDVQKIPIKGEWWLAVVTPGQRLATIAARSVLPEQIARPLFVQQMANTAGVVAAFALGDHDLMRRSLADLFAEPRRAPLIESFKDAKEAALTAGALGCSISGAGPTTFAICADERTARRASEAMMSAYGEGATAAVGQPALEGAKPV